MTRSPWLLPAVLATLMLAAAGITTAIDPALAWPLVPEVLLGLAGGAAGLALGRRTSVEALVAPLVALASVASLLLLTPLGEVRLGAVRNLELGLLIPPAALWVLASHVAVAAVAAGSRRHQPWLAAALMGGLGAAALMPELSILPQIVAGLVVVAWLVGRRGWVVIPVALGLVAVALSPLLPYVERRWLGWLDPRGHAQGAGYDYQALSRLVRESGWLGAPEGVMPRSSSPTEDYWLAAAVWRLGRLPMLAWLGGLTAALWGVHRRRSGASPRRMMGSAIAAGMVAAVAVHAGYNLGFLPITAIGLPFAGLSGGVTAVQLFGLGFALAASAPEEAAVAADAPAEGGAGLTP